MGLLLRLGEGERRGEVEQKYWCILEKDKVKRSTGGLVLSKCSSAEVTHITAHNSLCRTSYTAPLNCRALRRVIIPRAWKAESWKQCWGHHTRHLWDPNLLPLRLLQMLFPRCPCPRTPWSSNTLHPVIFPQYRLITFQEAIITETLNDSKQHRLT